MLKKLLLILPLLLLAARPDALGAPARTSSEVAREYEQVRSIALRDPKVRAAFANANERLEAKIVEIDPALSGYAKQRQHSGPEPAAPRKEARHKPVAKPASKKSATPSGSTHVVVAGETLGAIARDHHVSVASLKSANHIEDERKLRVGQTLTIPSPRSPRSAAPASAASAPKEESTWSRLKSSF